MNQIKAVIWDYDGALVDTGPKNLNVTRKIVKVITGKDFNDFSAIQSLPQYLQSHRVSINWRDYYKKEFGISEEKIDAAGRLWTGYQLDDDTPVPLFDGIPEVIQKLKDFPQGVVSQNSHTVIKNTLNENGLLTYFDSIIGYEEVALDRQKPVPDGLLLCIRQLTNNSPGTIFFVGDHETDVLSVLNTNKFFAKENLGTQVISIGIFYSGNMNTRGWKTEPDYKITKPNELFKIINEYSK